MTGQTHDFPDKHTFNICSWVSEPLFSMKEQGGQMVLNSNKGAAHICADGAAAAAAALELCCPSQPPQELAGPAFRNLH